MENNEYQWVSDFKVKIASYLKMKIRQSHPKAYVTDKSKDLSDPTFPTVYFHAMPFAETGQDLEGRSVNGITATKVKKKPKLSWLRLLDFSNVCDFK